MDLELQPDSVGLENSRLAEFELKLAVFCLPTIPVQYLGLAK